MDIQNLFTMHLGLHGSYGYTGLHDFDAGSMSILCTTVSSLGVGMGGAEEARKKWQDWRVNMVGCGWAGLSPVEACYTVIVLWWWMGG